MKSNLLCGFVKSVLAGGLLFGSQVFAAEPGDQWESFTNVVVGSERVYLDRTSVKVPDGQPHWRQLRVIVQADLNNNASYQTRSEEMGLTIDCENAKARKDGSKSYDRLWAQGEVVYSGKGEDTFRALDLDSTTDDNKAMGDLYRKVCEK